MFKIFKKYISFVLIINLCVINFGFSAKPIVYKEKKEFTQTGAYKKHLHDKNKFLKNRKEAVKAHYKNKKILAITYSSILLLAVFPFIFSAIFKIGSLIVSKITPKTPSISEELFSTNFSSDNQICPEDGLCIIVKNNRELLFNVKVNGTEQIINIDLETLREPFIKKILYWGQQLTYPCKCLVESGKVICQKACSLNNLYGPRQITSEMQIIKDETNLDKIYEFLQDYIIKKSHLLNLVIPPKLIFSDKTGCIPNKYKIFINLNELKNIFLDFQLSINHELGHIKQNEFIHKREFFLYKPILIFGKNKLEKFNREINADIIGALISSNIAQMAKNLYDLNSHKYNFFYILYDLITSYFEKIEDIHPLSIKRAQYLMELKEKFDAIKRLKS